MDTQFESGFRIRQIRTTTDDKGNAVPVLDANGNEIEVSSVDVPLHVEAKGADAIHAHVLEHFAAPAASLDDAGADR
jgi:hypothetical protein